MSIFRPIHHAFAPLADARFCLLALGLLARPLLWRRGPAGLELRNALRRKYRADAALFSSGREGLLALFKSLNIGSGDEVIVQAYTCVVVPNAITAAGANAVFVDVEKETLSLDPAAVRKAVTARTKAIVCQHTFGIPAPLEELRRICDGRGVPLIEDCAHVIQDESGPELVGMAGDFVLLSFGRDKAISGVAGGAIISRNTVVSDMLLRLENAAENLSLPHIMRLLIYPLLYAAARPLYGLLIGKALLRLCSLLGILPPVVTSAEKKGRQSPVLHRIPNACASLALDQLKRLREINDRRRALTRFYAELCAERGLPVLRGIRENLPLQKFPMFITGAEKTRRFLKRKNIHLHDGWTGCVICPESADPESAGYKDGDGPRAEEIREQILCLPTHPATTIKQAGELIEALCDIHPS